MSYPRGVDLPLRIPDAAVHLTGRVLIESSRRYRDQFRGDFVVVLHPTWNREHTEQEGQRVRLSAQLRSAEVPVLDYSEQAFGEDDVIDPRCDLHPNGRSNARLVARLVEDLEPHL